MKKRQFALGLSIVMFSATITLAQPLPKRFVESKSSTLYDVNALKTVSAAVKAEDAIVSGGKVVVLQKAGDGVSFKAVRTAQTLAIRYASTGVGIADVYINGKIINKINFHSSGNSSQFLNSVVKVKMPIAADVVIKLATSDVALRINQVAVGDNLNLPPDIWNLPELPVADGPFKPDWKAIGNTYMAPDWWREAKFGAWSHWDPQSEPEQGDWYARKMYQENSPVYKFHVKTYGHPSKFGYKDITNIWVIDKWNPEELMALYVQMGARYFMAMGVHHDNFDLWNSKYQPWNSVNIGPKKDIVGIYEKIARKHGLRFGIGFHNTPPRTWGQFMPVKYLSDKNGELKGVPYDGLNTVADGKGKWWDGFDPVDLYGPVHSAKDAPLRSPFANQFMWRVDDAITKYHPDVIYFDEHAGDSQVDLGVHMGLGFLAPQLIANYYNKSLKWNKGKMDVVVNLKGVGGRYNSFQNSNELLPYVEHSLVKSSEKIIEREIMAYPFQTEESISEWHYETGQKYLTAAEIVKILMENVCRNGTLLLNLTQHNRGDLDAVVVTTAKDIGAWLKLNGEAIYGSRPFEVHGDANVYYTRNKGKLYATCNNWQSGTVKLTALATDGATLGKVTKVELLGDGATTELSFVQNEQGLTVNVPTMSAIAINGIADATLAAGYRVLRITHSKTWINDDDPGVMIAQGWFRQSNLNNGDFNNDLTTSNVAGAKWSFSFAGTNVSVVAPKQAGAGKVNVLLDGKLVKIVDLSASGDSKRQQTVFTAKGLKQAAHTLTIINAGNKPVAIDALIVNDSKP
ncbi:alpha-L-fucosidase [Mucilaginibacter auburnensis]|uniref:alpha-L-fucosidase n=1 Tax=Mucilaginibacter auburnensis TaxID=1457233 RepID=A0A2H9VP14_9SPHI|nr:alpha-L-fucosidase [Mucilaginibacter auburnensis]PJJ80084.1 alpha-L-fucosidase [Mucilaginibacter auburnensis]